MNEQKIIFHHPFVGVKWNDKFICIRVYSGYGRSVIDPDVEPYFLSPQCEDATLGQVVCEALSRSRTIPPEQLGEFFDLKRTKAHYEQWVADMMARYGYKTRRALFKQMLSCEVMKQDSIITFGPSRHDRLEGWGLTKKDIAEGMTDEVIVDTATPEEIGAALRRAMSRSR